MAISKSANWGQNNIGKLLLLSITQVDNSETQLKKFLRSSRWDYTAKTIAKANSTMYLFIGFPLLHVSFLQSPHFYSLRSSPITLMVFFLGNPGHDSWYQAWKGSELPEQGAKIPISTQSAALTPHPNLYHFPHGRGISL